MKISAAVRREPGRVLAWCVKIEYGRGAGAAPKPFDGLRPPPHFKTESRPQGGFVFALLIDGASGSYRCRSVQTARAGSILDVSPRSAGDATWRQEDDMDQRNEMQFPEVDAALRKMKMELLKPMLAPAAMVIVLGIAALWQARHLGFL
jgi:hypothetical protein